MITAECRIKHTLTSYNNHLHLWASSESKRICNGPDLGARKVLLGASSAWKSEIRMGLEIYDAKDNTLLLSRI